LSELELVWHFNEEAALTA